MFFLSWIGAILTDRKAHTQKVQDRYQDYRALAEGLRVQFYWSWAGFHDQVAEAYPKRQREELFWIRHALCEWTPEAVATQPEPRSVLDHWIQHQLNYFGGHGQHFGAAEKNARLNHWYKKWARSLLYIGIGCGGLAMLVMWTGSWWMTEEVVYYLKYLLIFFSGLGIVSAATFYAWRERFAFAKHAKNYSAMARIYQEAKDRLEQDKESLETILKDLGREAITETTEWLMLHRERHATEARL